MKSVYMLMYDDSIRYYMDIVKAKVYMYVYVGLYMYLLGNLWLLLYMCFVKNSISSLVDIMVLLVHMLKSDYRKMHPVDIFIHISRSYHSNSYLVDKRS